MGFIHKNILCLGALCFISACCPKDKADAMEKCWLLADLPEEADCADHAAKEADAQLDRTYRALMEHISSKGQARLSELETDWLAYRQKQCEFASASLEGASHTAWSMNFDACYRRLTVQHTEELRSQLDCQEGDTGCGGQ